MSKKLTFEKLLAARDALFKDPPIPRRYWPRRARELRARARRMHKRGQGALVLFY